MKELSTIQKREKLNKIYAVDEQGNGGANHIYHVYRKDEIPTHEDVAPLAVIRFQNGARKEEGSVTGICDQDLLEIVRDRLRGFQQGSLPSRETAIALTHIEEALLWLNKRTEDRIERNVLGTNQK